MSVKTPCECSVFVRYCPGVKQEREYKRMGEGWVSLAGATSIKVSSPIFPSLSSVDIYFIMKSALAVSTAFSVLSATVEAYANPLSCSGTCTNAHDPSLVRRDDGTYFRFSTGKSLLHFDCGVLSRATTRARPSGQESLNVSAVIELHPTFVGLLLKRRH